ncbi:2-oxoglutarate dehydrogenase E1 component [Alphaproteobacteria bacterium SO-S41]|nr:2-oxoglutarate dehydrogenase E1 component [Alphaproteobacteria bacterium SO-S41]
MELEARSAPGQTRAMASNSALLETSFLTGANAAFIEDLYDRYAADPNSVDQSWRDLFAGLGKGAAHAATPSWGLKNGNGMVGALAEDYLPPAPKAPKKTNGAAGPAAVAKPALGDSVVAALALKAPSPDAIKAATLDSVRATQLIRAYRARGHLAANLDPLKLGGEKQHPELDPFNFGFLPQDMDRPIFLDNMLGLQYATMKEIVEICRETYCGDIGYEFVHVTDPDEKRWIQERIEGREKGASFSPEGKAAILNKLIEAEGFENYCTRKFTGTKRFGLDGGEAVIPALEQIIKRGGALGAREIAFGMSHRGRLNVLANVLSKPYIQIFHEFQGGSSNPKDVGGSGDVKYHLGASSDRSFDGNKVHLSLAPNPSHLEAVNPVVLGKVRAKQVQLGNGDVQTGRGMVIPVLMHGDAAFAGQGVVAECFAMSGTRGYRTGGTIHIVVNNQIGFTTSPHHARSSPYPSDIAKMVEAPILHVNGDNPEAVVHCARIATEFRQRFLKDVVVDMFCYRRFGHNETLEPTFTQPLMYRAIKDHPSTLTLYEKKLADEGTLTIDEIEAMKADFAKRLDDELEASKTFKANKADWLDGLWSGMDAGQGSYKRGDTAVDVEILKEVGKALSTVPETFNAHRTVSRQLAAKAAMFETGQGIDWATAEALAFGTLALEGVPVRLSGQDSREGTFSQRHASLVDQADEHRYVLLNHIRKDQKAEVDVIDSLLSEFAVLGFEYGYSLAAPNTLVLWEAQFGDFSNGAQVIIDQFISSGETKWLRLSGLVLLLPHGYEGQGPEHSSARPERFLQLCAEKNMQVANLTTPSNYYHALRRQIRRNSRKPLVLMTPKSLLRHKRAVSQLVEMGPGTSFHRLLWDDAEQRPGSSVKLKADKDIRRVVLCTGKVYYDLFEDREKKGIDDVQLIRVEQLYPYPEDAVERELMRFKQAEIVWVQEEPRNMGYWTYIAPLLEETMIKAGVTRTRPRYIGRAAAASPATGLSSTHQAELRAFMDETFAP